MDKLKACPFCGGRAMIAATLDDMYRPMCEKDGCCCLEGYQTRAEAIAAWNDRPREQRLLQALKEAREALAPFAREADSHDRPDIADQDRFGGDICFGDFRLARQALAKIDEAGGAG